MFGLIQTAVVVPNFSSYTVQMIQLRLQSKGEDWRIVALLQRNEKVQSIGDVCDKQTRGVFGRYIEKNKNILYNFRQISL